MPLNTITRRILPTEINEYLRKPTLWLEEPAKSINLPLDTANMIAAQLTCVFIAITFSKTLQKSNISNNSRYLVSILFGFLVVANVFNILDAVELFILPSIIYGFMRFLPKYSHHLTLFTCLSFLSYYHIKGMLLRDMESQHIMLDVGTCYMIMVQKLSSLAYNYHDGKYYKNHDFLNKAHPKASVKHKAIYDRPKYLQVLAYSYNFCGIMGGPMIFFKDFVQAMETSTKKSENGNNCNYKAGGKKFAKSILFLIAVDRLENTFGNSSIFTKKSWVDQASLSSKILILPVVFLIIQRCKYYFFWLLAEAINNFAGIGYDEKENNWDLISNNNILQVELARNPQGMINNWNMGSARWLRLVVFERISNKAIATPATFLLSAVWHGFWPGQYFFFAFTHLSLMTYKNLNKSFVPFIQSKTDNKRVLNQIYFLGSIAHHIIFDFNAICFTILQTWDRTFYYISSCYFVPQILLIFGAFLPWKKIFRVSKSDQMEKKEL